MEELQYFGREIKKTFEGAGQFHGKVVDYHKKTGYRVQYEDGDSEDLNQKELVRAGGNTKVPSGARVSRPGARITVAYCRARRTSGSSSRPPAPCHSSRCYPSGRRCRSRSASTLKTRGPQRKRSVSTLS